MCACKSHNTANHISVRQDMKVSNTCRCTEQLLCTPFSLDKYNIQNKERNLAIDRRGETTVKMDDHLVQLHITEDDLQEQQYLK